GAELYRYSAADLTQIARGADIPLPGGAIDLSLPASSITLLVTSNTTLLPGDINGDGVVNLADVPMFVSVLVGTDTDLSHRSRCDFNADGSANGVDMPAFIAAITR